MLHFRSAVDYVIIVNGKNSWICRLSTGYPVTQTHCEVDIGTVLGPKATDGTHGNPVVIL